MIKLIWKILFVLIYIGSIIGIYLTCNDTKYTEPTIDKNKQYQWDDHVLYYNYGKEHPKKVFTPLGEEAINLQEKQQSD